MNSHLNMAMASSRQQDFLRTAAEQRRTAGIDAPQSMLARFAGKLGAIAGARRPAPQPAPAPARRSSSVTIAIGEIAHS